jgi:hypothetical protein
MSVNKELNCIESLIEIQLQYLIEMKNSNLKSFESNPSRAGFYRVSLEINKQINKFKNK